MKLAHQVWIKVFSHEKYNEDERLIADKLLQLFPFSLEEEKIQLKKTNAKGFNEKNIIVFKVILKKERHINRFLDNLKENIDDEQKKLIIEQSESRLDENLDFFIRFNKEEYLTNNKLIITNSGNCFHIKFSVAAFPKKREVALNIIRAIIAT
ncbi:hypothetical protein HYX01_03340 [Candidatus Woesearchaeota archaeon]|nr:hypothetical protein [Candidatus Woesearchaeota archaeon]